MTGTGLFFHSGREPFRADSLCGRPLGYDRDMFDPGARLPVPGDPHLSRALAGCDEVAVHFPTPKLGDTLLALGAVRALWDWARMCRPCRRPVFRLVGPQARLLAAAIFFRTEAGGVPVTTGAPATPARRVVIGDAEGVVQARGWPGTGTYLVVDPTRTPCWLAGGIAHPYLPDRYYLAIERHLAVRLPGEPPFQPGVWLPSGRLAVALKEREVLGLDTIAAVTATSWPARKDYTANRYLRVAEELSARTGRRFHLLLVGGQDQPGPGRLSSDGRMEVADLGAAPRDELVPVFARCGLVLGNDTGLTHLAAMSRKRLSGGAPEVIGLYARHSHSKWRTGLPNHHAVATGFSELMHREDRCPVRDQIDDCAYGAAADLDTVGPEFVADAVLRTVLELAR